MPLSVSVSAAFLSLLGANQREPYHLRMASRIWPSLILNGRMLCGVIASLRSSCATMAGEPQKSQRWAVRPSTNTEIARQFWHWTSWRAAPQPRPDCGLLRAAARSCSTTAVPSASRWASLQGTWVPQ
ncbi:hypothetical protein D3C71_1645800 [compost metagenome]